MKHSMWTLGQKAVLREQPGEPSGVNPGDPPPTDPPPAPDFSWVPENFKTDDGHDFEGFRSSYDEMASIKEQHDERLAQIPESAEAYEFAVPEDIDLSEFKLPEDFNVKTLFEDEGFKPLFSEFGAILHKVGAPADASKQMMGLVAKYEATKYAQAMATGQAELAKIENGEERITNLHRALEKRLPEAEAAALSWKIVDADTLRAFEKLISPSKFPVPPADPPESKEDNRLNTRYPSSTR